MNAGIELLGWDTRFFGATIARARVTPASLDTEIAAARAADVECLYLIVDGLETGTIERAIRLGAILSDLRLELVASQPESIPGDERTRLASAEQRKDLERLAVDLAAVSRFSRDPRFPPQAVSRMYEIWISRCLEEGLIVVPADDLAGFVGARREGEIGRVELVYVSPDARGRGLGRTLLTRAMRDLETSEMRVATQVGSLPAQRLYQSVGFQPETLEAVLHLWLDCASDP